MNQLQKIVFIFMVFTITMSQKATSATSKNQKVINFSITEQLKDQTIKNLYSLMQSAHNELKEMLTTPKNPTKWQLRRQKGQDWFCTWQGSKKIKTLKVLSWFPGALTGVGTLAALGALCGATPWRPDYKKPTLTDQASHAAFSLAALAAQTYLSQRAGFNASKPLTPGNIVESVKNAAQQQALHKRTPKIAKPPLLGEEPVAQEILEEKKMPPHKTNVLVAPAEPCNEQRSETLQNFFGG